MHQVRGVPTKLEAPSPGQSRQYPAKGARIRQEAPPSSMRHPPGQSCRYPAKGVPIKQEAPPSSMHEAPTRNKRLLYVRGTTSGQRRPNLATDTHTRPDAPEPAGAPPVDQMLPTRSEAPKQCKRRHARPLAARDAPIKQKAPPYKVKGSSTRLEVPLLG